MAGAIREAKTHLSSHVLEMKFMQRSAARKEQVENEAEQRRQIDDEHWVLDLPECQQHDSPFIVESSYMISAGLRFGRLSFQAFNPEIEKLMRNNEAMQQEVGSELRERENAVSDDEMAHRYSTLVQSIDKKFSKKRRSKNMSEESGDESSKKKKTKRTFLKPEDD